MFAAMPEESDFSLMVLNQVLSYALLMGREERDRVVPVVQLPS